MPRTRFARALKRARKAAGLSQVQLGQRAGLTGSYISMLESGRKPPPAPPVVARLCRALGVDPDPLQEAAGLERAPAPIRRRIERIEREEGRVRRTRDRLLTTTLFHIAHRPGPLNPMGEFLDLSPGQRTLLGRLIGRVRRVRDVGEAKSKTEALLEDASPDERDMLVEVLPSVLAGGTAGAAPPAKADPQLAAPAGATTLPVFAGLDRSGTPIDRMLVDPRHHHAQAFLWKLPDDDAYPRLEAGDLLLIDPVAEAKSGDLVAFRHEGRDQVRVLHRQGDEVRLEPTRPEGRPIRMPAARFAPTGVVIWMSRALR